MPCSNKGLYFRFQSNLLNTTPNIYQNERVPTKEAFVQLLKSTDNPIVSGRRALLQRLTDIQMSINKYLRKANVCYPIL